MSMGTTLKFHVPQGWTIRKIATALAREWLPPFRAEPVVKAARWVMQPVVEDSGKGGHPLWEPGISTELYEERMERSDLCWAIRASIGRGRVTVLARLAMSKDDPSTIQVECSQASFPETLFDAGKVEEFLEAQGANGSEGLFTALLTDNGFRLAPH